MDPSSTDRNIKVAIVVGTVVAFVVLLGELYLLPETWLSALFAAACVVTIRRRGPNRARNTAIAAALGVASVIGVNRFITYNIEVVN